VKRKLATSEGENLRQRLTEADFSELTSTCEISYPNGVDSWNETA